MEMNEDIKLGDHLIEAYVEIYAKNSAFLGCTYTKKEIDQKKIQLKNQLRGGQIALADIRKETKDLQEIYEEIQS